MSPSLGGSRPQSASIESFERVLRELGLAESEARAYRFLLTSQGATPASIARETGQSRGKIYETMRRLVEKGFAREEPTRPIRYSPTPLQEIIVRAAARVSRQTQALRDVHVWFQRLKIPAPASVQKVMRPGDVRVISGRRACMTELRRVLAEAQSTFLMSAGGRFPERFASMAQFQEEIRAAGLRGVSLKILLPLSAESSGHARALEERLGRGVLGFTAHVYDGPTMTGVSDLASLEIIAQPDDESPNRGDDVGVRVENAVYAAACRARLTAAGEATAEIPLEGPSPRPTET